MTNEFQYTRNAYIIQSLAGLGLLVFGAIQMAVDMQPPSDIYYDHPDYPTLGYDSTATDTYFRDDKQMMTALFVGALLFTVGSAWKAYTTNKHMGELQVITKRHTEGTEEDGEESDLQGASAREISAPHRKFINLISLIKDNSPVKITGAVIIALVVSFCFAIAFGDYQRGIEDGPAIGDYYEDHYHYHEPSNPGTMALFSLLYGGAGVLAASAIIPNAWMEKAYNGAERLLTWAH